MKRVFEIDVLECPFCKGRRKRIALITEAPVNQHHLQSRWYEEGP